MRITLLSGERHIGFTDKNDEPWVNEAESVYGNWAPLSACEPRQWPVENIAGRAYRLYVDGEVGHQRQLHTSPRSDAEAGT